MFLVVLVAQSFRKRPQAGEKAVLPKWLQTIDSLTPGKSALLGMLSPLGGGLNPTNLLLIVGAMVALSQYHLAPGDDAVAILVFTLIGISTIAAPVLIYWAAGQNAAICPRQDEVLALPEQRRGDGSAAAGDRCRVDRRGHQQVIGLTRKFLLFAAIPGIGAELQFKKPGGGGGILNLRLSGYEVCSGRLGLSPRLVGRDAPDRLNPPSWDFASSPPPSGLGEQRGHSSRLVFH